MKKVVVPEGMALAIWNHASRDGRWLDIDLVKRDLDVALEWLSENPIVPTDAQAIEAFGDSRYRFEGTIPAFKWFVIEWQRRMFLAPEHEVPEEVKDLLFGDGTFPRDKGGIDACIIEAFRRGQKAK